MVEQELDGLANAAFDIAFRADVETIDADMKKLFRDAIAAAEARGMAEIERLREALREIAAPIEYMQERADREGAKLDGHIAVRHSSDAEYLKNIARAALNGGQHE